MDEPEKLRHLSLTVVRMGPGVFATAEGAGSGVILHRLPSRPPDPDGGLPALYLLQSPPMDRGAFLITCDGLPGVAFLSDSEEGVLALTRLAIKEALAER